MPTQTETEAFAQRLRRALEASGVRASPTVLANEFNLRFWGRSVTPHTARNWLLGKAIPTQDKLRVLADWLSVSPDELRFGRQGVVLKASEGDATIEGMNMADREMLSRYLTLPLNERKTAREVIKALAITAAGK